MVLLTYLGGLVTKTEENERTRLSKKSLQGSQEQREKCSEVLYNSRTTTHVKSEC